MLVSDVGALQEAEFFEVECGDKCKDLAVAESIWLSLLESGADRNAVIVNLGGGSVSDLGGFVASAYKRGIKFVNVPTTLLAMVDASIGGKTALNMGGLKNQVGFFQFPQCVCIEPLFLDTLPRRQIMSGVFEMLKTFAVADKDSYDSVAKTLYNDSLYIEQTMIYRCAELKARIVSRDIMDCGERKILNFGHTFGHAIESLSLRHDTSPMTHGEAVALGMVCAMWLSVEKFGLHKGICQNLSDIVLPMVGKRNYSKKQIDELITLMSADKKNCYGKMRCVLLKDIGNAVWDVSVSDKESRNVFLKI